MPGYKPGIFLQSTVGEKSSGHRPGRQQRKIEGRPQIRS